MAACLQRPWYYLPLSIDCQQVSCAHGFICTKWLHLNLEGKWWPLWKLTFRQLMMLRAKETWESGRKVWTSLPGLDCSPSTCYITSYRITESSISAIILRIGDNSASLWEHQASKRVGNGLGNDCNVPCLRLIYSREREVFVGLWREQKLNGCRLAWE